jgi:hypothetical protein
MRRPWGWMLYYPVASCFLFLPHLEELLAQSTRLDPFRNRCVKEQEGRVSKCASGRDEVWHYAITNNPWYAKQPQPFRSWPYKSAAAAQRALENNRALCEMVARYFDHEPCRNTYGPVFCAACGSDTALTRRLLKHSLITSTCRQLDRWRGELQKALTSLRSIQQGGEAGPYSGGAALREYMRALRTAQGSALGIQEFVDRYVSGEGDKFGNLTRWLDSFTRFNLPGVERAGGAYLSSAVAAGPSTNSPREDIGGGGGGPAVRLVADEKIFGTYRDNWASPPVTWQVTGDATHIQIVISQGEVSIQFRGVRSASGGYDIRPTESPALKERGCMRVDRISYYINDTTNSPEISIVCDRGNGGYFEFTSGRKVR